MAGLNEFIGGLVPQAIILAGVINFVVSFTIITLLFALIYKVGRMLSLTGRMSGLGRW